LFGGADLAVTTSGSKVSSSSTGELAEPFAGEFSEQFTDALGDALVNQ
jgi:hypothetical protein